MPAPRAGPKRLPALRLPEKGHQLAGSLLSYDYHVLLLTSPIHLLPILE